MPRNVNYNIVYDWIRQSKAFQKRKFHTIVQLYHYFNAEIKEHSITERGFMCNVNRCCDSFKKLNKIEHKRGDVKYIILDEDDNIEAFKKFLDEDDNIEAFKKCSSTRTSKRRAPATPLLSKKRRSSRIAVKSASSRKVGRPSRKTTKKSPNPKRRSNKASPSAPPSAPPSKASVDKAQNESSNCEEITKVSDAIRKMNKKDLPMALSFFMGKDRAKIIRDETEKQALGIKAAVIPYGDIIVEHLEAQIAKLQSAHLSFKGWTRIIQDYDPDVDEFSPFAIFDLRIKAFYLQKLYKYALMYYDSINCFKDIAALALLECNRQYEVHNSEDAALHTVNNPATLLMWFRSYRITDSFPNFAKLQ